LFKEGKTKFKQTDQEGMIVLNEFIYLRKKNAMFTTELFQKLKNRLAALRRSL
jgi:hypothetical protein